MALLNINCPYCSSLLQFPAELAGKKVKCPSCLSVFTPDAKETPAEPRTDNDDRGLPRRDPYEDDFAAPPPRVRSSFDDADYPASRRDCYREGDDDHRSSRYDDDYDSRRGGGQSWQRAHEAIFWPALALMIGSVVQMLGSLLLVVAMLSEEARAENTPDETAIGVLVFSGGFVLGVVVLVGSILMMKLRAYPLAMTSAIAAMIPCFCAFIGVPFGIWAVVAMNNPDNRQAFR